MECGNRRQHQGLEFEEKELRKRYITEEQENWWQRDQHKVIADEILVRPIRTVRSMIG